MSVIVLLTLKTKPDAYEEFGTILENILGDTASFEGCEGIYAAGDSENHTYLSLIHIFQVKLKGK